MTQKFFGTLKIVEAGVLTHFFDAVNLSMEAPLGSPQLLYKSTDANGFCVNCNDSKGDVSVLICSLKSLLYHTHTYGYLTDPYTHILKLSFAK